MVVYNNEEIPVTEIKYNAFAGCTEMTSLNIPYGITNISPIAFDNTMTLQIKIDAANTTYDCRENCNAIIETATNTLVCGFTNTVIPNSVEVIGEGAFQNNTEINVLNIPNSIRVIGSFAFSGCTGLTAVEIPTSVREIETYAFGYCTNLGSVSMPMDLDMLYPYAFGNTPWFTAWDAKQANGVVYWGTVAWYYKGIMPENTAITIKEGTRTLMRSLFYNNKTLTSITIPASVKSIGMEAFINCRKLESAYIPANTQFIGHDAFRDCSALKDVYNFSVVLPTIEFDHFKNVPVVDATLHVPASALEVYRNADQWKEFGNIVPLTEEDDVDGIESLTPTLSECEGAWYDLSGRKVNSQLKKGICIKNGKKILVK